MMQKVPYKISAKELNLWLHKIPSRRPFLVDVREEQEIAIAQFSEPALHLPLSKSSIWIESLQEHLPKNQPIVVFCHAGIRSWHFGNWLIKERLTNEVWNLDGGIDAWSIDVDPRVPRY